ncbi:MAG TPA: ATP-binding cassette domain-containing protein [Gammaproteobacteria bacterium]|nr:ATP-binding cassette domain-containing protein [Gammaproteobacteria bacterium]
MTAEQPVIDIRHLKTVIGDTRVHQDVNLEVKTGEILVLVGGSGSGKTVLLREMLALRTPTAGSIRIFNHELTKANAETLLAIQRRWGVLFQQNALFSSLTVLENVSFPFIEHTELDEKTIRELALLKIVLAGLPMEAAIKYPAELSGGMQKRAALARAIALDPELLFLDEPTAGLDPGKVIAFDELILDLQSTMGLTIVMVTHDVDSLKRVANRVAFLGEGKVLAVEPPGQLLQNRHPLIQAFFDSQKNGKRQGQ